MSTNAAEVWPSSVLPVTGGEEIRRRRLKLGMTIKELAEEAGVDRGRLSKMEDGEPVRPTTRAAVERVLDRIEAEVSGPYDNAEVTNTIELPDGTRVTFVGSAENVSEAAARFLARRKH